MNPTPPDRLGMAIAGACAVHCLLAPLLFASVPALALALRSFDSPWRGTAIGLLRLQALEALVVTGTVLFAATCLALGWRRHRHPAPLAWLAVSLPCFAVGLLRPMSAVDHGLVLACGGVAVLLAHAGNRRLLQQWRRQLPT